MAVASAVEVPAASRAVPGARARHRADLGVSSGVQLGGAGDLDSGAPPGVPLAGHERLLTALAVAVNSASYAVPGAITPHRIHPGTHSSDGAGDHKSCSPPAVPLAEHEQMGAVLAVYVEAAGRAAPSARTRHRGIPDLLGVQTGGAGDLDGGAPPAVPLARHEHLAMAVAVCVTAADRAVPGIPARHRAGPGLPAGVEAGGAGDLDGGAPPAVPLADNVRLAMAVAVPIRAAYSAVPGA